MTIFTLLKNLLALCGRLPAIIAVAKSLADIIGSEMVQKLLEAIRDVLKSESPEKIPEIEIPQTENLRERFRKRLQKRIALTWLGMSEPEYDRYCLIIGKESENNIA
jgi:hypothetical protein